MVFVNALDVLVEVTARAFGHLQHVGDILRHEVIEVERPGPKQDLQRPELAGVPGLADNAVRVINGYPFHESHLR